jgi:CBS domain-containing protein
MDASSVRRVSHPILHLEVVDHDQVRAGVARVFCRLQRRSVDVDVCRSCPPAQAIHDGATPSVECDVVAPAGVLDADLLGLRTEVGTLLEGGSTVVADSASLEDAIGVLRVGDLRSVAVVGGNHVLVGVLHDVALSARRRSAAGAPVDLRTVMSRALAIHEATPVRRALLFLASAHLRQAAVVDGDGVPLGIFRDVDGLRWIARARGGAIDPAWIDRR